MRRYISYIFIISLILCSCSRRGRNGSSYRHSSPIENTTNGSSRRASRHDHSLAPNGNRTSKESSQSIAYDRSPNNGTVLTGKQIYEKCSSAVFMVVTSTYNASYQGSGFFISSTGTAVSNYHVFEGTSIGAEWILTTDGSRYKVKNVKYKSKNEDIIIFTVDSPKSFNYLKIATKKPSIGDKAYAIGSPRGLDNTLSDGMISQIRENDYLQISVPIDHGSSGGALLNEYGEVIGITSGGRDDSGANLNYAISIDVVRRHL